MDAHVFRIIGREALSLLHGARVEKIHSPFPDVTVFLCYREGSKFRIVLRSGKKNPALFLARNPLPNPPRPAAYVMRLRKYAGGLRLGQGTMDATRRILNIPILKEGKEQPFRLVLNMKNGPSITDEALDIQPALWPGEDVIRQLCADGKNAPGAAPGAWLAYPLLTPPLRETLSCLSFLDAMALMVDLEEGGGGLFFYADPEGKAVLYSAWPLPDAAVRKKSLRELPEYEATGNGAPVCQATGTPDCEKDASGGHGTLGNVSIPGLAATSRVDEDKLMDDFSFARKSVECLPQKKSDKRLKKTLAKLDQEEKRLLGMSRLQEDAKRIQECLWQFSADHQAESITIQRPDGEKREIPLDPRMTLRKNMARMFHQAARGERGLSMLAQRRRELAAAEASPLPPGVAGDHPVTRKASLPQEGNGPVARFVSSDGYVMLRGKNAKGNQAVIKMGQPYDYWLHAEDGPSAHLVIRRAHAADEVPEATLMEAAELVAEKSRYRDESRADIMVCLLRHVHGIKGASPGTVRVDKTLMRLHTRKDL